MRSRWALAAGLAAGVVLDALFGDPRRGHPVAAFGRAATALESRDYADSRPRGVAHAAACVLAVAAPTALLHRRTRGRPPWEAAAVAAAVWAVTGARSLHHLAERAVVALDSNDLRSAREVLPGLCGRDPAGLNAAEITRAVIESVAENTSDAVVAPLLWGAVAGIPGLVGYRAVNTLDAMVGHRSPRYLRFGWASARLDDVANWIPARVTAALTIACAPLIYKMPRVPRITPRVPRITPRVPRITPRVPRITPRVPRITSRVPPALGMPRVPPALGMPRVPPALGMPRVPPATQTSAASALALASSALRVVLRDGGRHPSPNAGRCEAAFAGALGVRLGGTNVYGGVTEVRPELGQGNAPEPDDIRRAIALSRAVTVAATALAVLIALGRCARRDT
jgi:adenosylcobinamide-phosphate synthase